MPRAFDERERTVIKEALLTEAARLIRSKGIQGTSVDDLTQGVSIAKGSFYAFFPTREALFWELIKREEAQMLADIGRVARGPGSTAAKVRTILTDHYLREDSIVRSLSQREIEFITRKLPIELLEADRVAGEGLITTLLAELHIPHTRENAELVHAMIQSLRIIATEDRDLSSEARRAVTAIMADAFAAHAETMGESSDVAGQ